MCLCICIHVHTTKYAHLNFFRDREVAEITNDHFTINTHFIAACLKKLVAAVLHCHAARDDRADVLLC